MAASDDDRGWWWVWLLMGVIALYECNSKSQKEEDARNQLDHATKAAASAEKQVNELKSRLEDLEMR